MDDILPPLSLYAHWPFCARKCPYCDFFSHPPPHDDLADYAVTMGQACAVWRRARPWDERPLTSLYLGGGTPSLLTPEQVAAFLTAVTRHWSLAPACEITLEANPESLTADKALGYRQAGINRISLGVQAWDDRRLRQLERPHDVAAARWALEAIQMAGFTHYNVDLIYGTPNHDTTAWRTELDQLLSEYAPPHLSGYQLTIEPGTPLAARMATRNAAPLPDEDTQMALFRVTRQHLAHHGYQAYEISNFARPEYACRHNLNYWRFGDYLGIGAGAHGKLTQPDGHIDRTENPTDVARWSTAIQAWTLAARIRRISVQEAAGDYVLGGLRCVDGVERVRYHQLRGHDLWERATTHLKHFLEAGWIDWSPTHLRLTESGLLISNEIIMALLEDPATE
jgi:oxygen-independent coproporphyrinogen-3 oxidase